MCVSKPELPYLGLISRVGWSICSFILSRSFCWSALISLSQFFAATISGTVTMAGWLVCPSRLDTCRGRSKRYKGPWSRQVFLITDKNTSLQYQRKKVHQMLYRNVMDKNTLLSLKPTLTYEHTHTHTYTHTHTHTHIHSHACACESTLHICTYWGKK